MMISRTAVLALMLSLSATWLPSGADAANVAVAPLAIGAAKIEVTAATIAAGRLIIAGKADTVGRRVTIDGTTLVATANALKNFRFDVLYRTSSCWIVLRTTAGTLTVLVANCGPASFTYRGGWVASKTFKVGDVVFSAGSSWYARRTSLNKQPGLPANAADWAIMAVRGAVGARGATGLQGLAGVAGAVGPPGPAGGPPGPTGATGADGATGLAGPAGQIGLTGSQGLTGTTGIQGSTGLTGSQGVPGTTGAIGPDGALGGVGPTGPEGPDGPTGEAGAIGADGAIGLTGSQGATGSEGPIGLTGSQGLTGTTGAQGSTGLTGSQGVPGTTGSQGPQGAEGPSGFVNQMQSVNATVVTVDLTEKVLCSVTITPSGGHMLIAASSHIAIVAASEANIAIFGRIKKNVTGSYVLTTAGEGATSYFQAPTLGTTLFDSKFSLWDTATPGVPVTYAVLAMRNPVGGLAYSSDANGFFPCYISVTDFQ